jgi:hypothetical protein
MAVSQNWPPNMQQQAKLLCHLFSIGRKSHAIVPLIWKKNKNRSAVNIAVICRSPLFYMAVIQNSSVNILWSVKSRR